MEENKEQNTEQNSESLPNDFFKSDKSEQGLESTSSSLFTVSEDVNPLTTDVNKINQEANSSGVIGKKEEPPRKKLFVSHKSLFHDGLERNELLDTYVGRNYRKIAGKALNFSALIFCPFYYLYRKMVILGILIFVGLLFVHLKFNNIAYDIGYYLIFGFLFNFLYLAKSQRRVSRIKMKNGEFDTYTVSRICSKNGGTSIILLILGVLIDLIILAFFCANFYLNPMTKFLEKFGVVFTYENGNMNFSFDKTLIDTNIYYDDKPGYYITKSDVNAKDYFKMVAPNSHFVEKTSDVNYSFYYTLGNDSMFDMCSVELYGIKGYSSSQKFIEAVYKEKKEEVFEKKVNDIDWQYIHHESLKGTNYYYTTTIDGEVFLLNYYRDNAGMYDCMFYEDAVLSAIKKK